MREWVTHPAALGCHGPRVPQPICEQSDRAGPAPRQAGMGSSRYKWHPRHTRRSRRSGCGRQCTAWFWSLPCRKPARDTQTGIRVLPNSVNKKEGHTPPLRAGGQFPTPNPTSRASPSPSEAFPHSRAPPSPPEPLPHLQSPSPTSKAPSPPPEPLPHLQSPSPTSKAPSPPPEPLPHLQSPSLTSRAPPPPPKPLPHLQSPSLTSRAPPSPRGVGGASLHPPLFEAGLCLGTSGHTGLYAVKTLCIVFSLTTLHFGVLVVGGCCCAAARGGP